MVKIYGCSDDIVEIGNSDYYMDEIGCYDSNVRLKFSDGTVILVGYCKPNTDGVWWIKIEHRGTANQRLTICDDEDSDIYSDVFEIEAEIIEHDVIERW